MSEVLSHHPEHCPPSFCQTTRQHRTIAEQHQHGNMSERLSLKDETRSVSYKSSVCCFTHMHRDHMITTRSCLTIVSVQSARFIVFNHSCRQFLSNSGSRYTIKFLIWGCITSILAPNITTRLYFKLHLELSRICAGLNGPPPLFCS